MKNIALNGAANVFPQQKALLDRTGKCSFYLATENLGHHGVYSGRDKECAKSEIEVETTTLDDLFSHREGTIHIIKMDAEGAEPLILKGMKGVISRCDKLALFTELNAHNLRLGDHSPEALLTNLKFILHLVDDHAKLVSQIEVGELIQICAAQSVATRNLLCIKGGKS